MQTLILFILDVVLESLLIVQIFNTFLAPHFHLPLLNFHLALCIFLFCDTINLNSATIWAEAQMKKDSDYRLAQYGKLIVLLSFWAIYGLLWITR